MRYSVVKEIETDNGFERYLFGTYDLDRAKEVAEAENGVDGIFFTVIPENDLENWEIIE